MRRIVAALILLCGCSNESSPTGTNGPVPTIHVYKSKSSAIAGRRAEIISRQSRWVEVWDEITANVSPKPAIPIVDFDNVILIFAAGGELANSCSDIRIESVTRVNGALAVSIVEERWPTCSCLTVVIRPVHVVSVPRAATDASFEFRVANLSGCPVRLAIYLCIPKELSVPGVPSGFGPIPTAASVVFVDPARSSMMSTATHMI